MTIKITSKFTDNNILFVMHLRMNKSGNNDKINVSLLLEKVIKIYIYLPFTRESGVQVPGGRFLTVLFNMFEKI